MTPSTEASDSPEEFQTIIKVADGVLSGELHVEETRVRGEIKPATQRDVCVLWTVRKHKATLAIFLMGNQNYHEVVEPRESKAEL